MFSAAQLFRRPTRNSFTGTQRSPRILWHTIRKNFKHFQWISLEARLMHSAQLRENSALSFSLAFSLTFSLTLFVLSLSLSACCSTLCLPGERNFCLYFWRNCQSKNATACKSVWENSTRKHCAYARERAEKAQKKEKERETERESAKQSESQWEWEHKHLWNA